MVTLSEENDPGTNVAVNCKAINISNDSEKTLNIPDDIIFVHILPRLPVKTLTRFKSVSKLWLFTISTPKFAKSHLKFSPNQFLLIYDEPLKFMLLSYDNKEIDTLKNPIELENLFGSYIQQKISKNEIIFVGTDIGLDCFVGKNIPFFFICNPALHPYREIMYPNPNYNPSSYWFGYVPSIDDFKIVALFSLSSDEIERENRVYFYVFSLKTGKGKRRRCLDSYFTSHETLSPDAKVINDILFWSIVFPGFGFWANRVVGFDLVNEEMKVFPLLDCLAYPLYYNTKFFLRNAFLSAQCLNVDDQKINVWTLTQFDDWSSWEKVCSFNLPCTYSCLVTPSGKFLVEKCYENQTQNQFMIVGPSLDDAKKQRQTFTCSCGNIENFSSVVTYVESLISPFKTIVREFIGEKDGE